MRKRTSSSRWAAYLAAAWLALAHVSGASQTDFAEYPLHEVGGDRTVTLDALRGQWVALHFLLRVDCAYCLLHVKSYALQSETRPEVRHLFIKPGTEEAIVRWAEGFEGEDAPGLPEFQRPPIYRDPRAALASRLGIRHGYEYRDDRRMHFPALILLNPDGDEVFRHTGENTADRFRFDQFAAWWDAMRRPFHPDAFHLLEGGVVAVGGYDPVAYFTAGQALKGDPDISADFNTLLFRFSSESNRERFREDPMRYLPAYGGWCAMHMTTGQQHEVDPSSFRIHDGRLYLFNRGVFTNARVVWERDIDAHITQADAHWEALSSPMPPTP